MPDCRNDQTQKVAQLFCVSPITGYVQTDRKGLATIDDQRLVQIAENHGLSEVLYATLQAASLLDLIPEAVRSRWCEMHAEALRRHIQRVEQLLSLHTVFRDANISYLLLKEYAFDQTLPASSCIRQSDLDILLPPAALGAAEQLLHADGYSRVQRPWPDEYRFKRAGLLSIDLHTSLDSAYGQSAKPLDSGIALAPPAYMPVGSYAIPVLNPIDGILFLIRHAALHHNFTPFRTAMNCWNYIARQDQDLLSRVPWEALDNLAWFSVQFLEQLTGYELPCERLLVPPHRVARLLFRFLMPDQKTYFNEDTSHRLKRTCRDGLHLCLYPRSTHEKLLCLARIARSRTRQWL